MDGANEVGGPPRSRFVTLGTSRLFVALLLPGLIVFAWVGIKDSGLWTARSAVPLGMGIVLTWRLAVAGVFVTDDEVRVVNLLRVRSVHRDCIVAVESRSTFPGSRNSSVALILDDGTAVRAGPVSGGDFSWNAVSSRPSIFRYSSTVAALARALGVPVAG